MGIGFAVISLLQATLGAGPSEGAETILVGEFSVETPGANLPQGWKPLTFPKIKQHTAYTLIDDAGKTIVKAESNRAASGLTRELEVELKATPYLSWSWKIGNVVTKSDPTRKEGDDYAARIYVTFKYDPSRLSVWQRTKYRAAKLIYGEYPPHAGISYIWDARLPPETGRRNAYTDRLHMIVVESGETNVGRWMSYRRNIIEDYRKAFGEEPPPLSGIAIMTDTDNTGESATAHYGDITLTDLPR